MRELTEFLEDEGFYSDKKRQVKISVTIEELRYIIDGLTSLKRENELSLYINEEVMKEEDISKQSKDIKFVESLHLDLV